jgi:DNA-binding beta-propeller fold protein YncE
MVYAMKNHLQGAVARLLWSGFAAFSLGILASSPAAGFVTFESGQVRPLALSPDGARLFACNTPDNTLEIFDVGPSGLDHVATVPVGLEPVAVAARSNTEVWVINHLSDSVSIVDLTSISDARVVRTLLVGDEPRDIVFGGTLGNRAFITTAHRGQNTPLHATIETELTTEGIGRADVWVFDATDLGTSLGGDAETILTLFGDTPRALAVSPDGSTVYAAVFHSGNQTTALSEGLVPNGGEPTGLPDPTTDHLGVPQPEVGLIVRYNGSQWLDELGRDWAASVRFTLPDHDVFVIDADANPPVQEIGPAGFYAQVGTVLFNMAVNPVSGNVYVSNTEAFNEVRFEGPGVYAAGFKPIGEPATVRGHLAESRITVLDGGGGVSPIHLNKHIDYDICCDPLPNTVNDRSLAFPLDMAVSSDGTTLFVTAFGSSKIGIFDTTELENDTFVPSTSDHVQLSGGGPTGIVLDEANSRLYTLTRFDNSISIVSTGTGTETAHLPLHNPEPSSVVEGRRFLYDARLTSAHGDQACASCHVFGDFDSLAWDLGDPDGTTITNPGPFVPPFGTGVFGTPDFRALKGPMTTQSLRGMDNHGSMHWRGDRTGGNDEGSSHPNNGSFDEDAAFKKFNPAFEGLIGRSEVLEEEQMQAFTDFILQVMYPPNPIRNLDSSMTASQLAGRNFYFGPLSDTVQNCNGCHVTNPLGNAGFGIERPGFFGSDGRWTFENEPQFLKVPHLRNMYQKVGMFGMPAVPFFNAGDNAHKGDQVRGFGFLHDGSTDTLFRFHNATVFNQNGINPTGIPAGAPGDPLRRDIETFMMAFPSNHAPIVGQQITRTDTTGAPVEARIDLLLDRVDNPNNPDDPDDLATPECDVVAKGINSGEPRGAVYAGGGLWETDREADGTISDATLRAFADTPGQEITFTAVPVGEGFRIGVDRDDDGFRDGDETDAGSDPASNLSLPCIAPASFGTKDRASIKDSKGQLNLKAAVVLGAYDRETIQVVLEDGGGVFFDSGLLGEALDLNASGTTYKFKSKTGAITRVQVKEDNKVAGGFKIKFKTKGAWAPGSADETEATTLVTLNIGGQCFTGNATSVN